MTGRPNARTTKRAIEAREPLPPIEKILDRLEVLWNKLEIEGQYVRANTVALAIEAIRRSEAKRKLRDRLQQLQLAGHLGSRSEAKP